MIMNANLGLMMAAVVGMAGCASGGSDALAVRSATNPAAGTADASPSPCRVVGPSQVVASHAFVPAGVEASLQDGRVSIRFAHRKSQCFASVGLDATGYEGFGTLAVSTALPLNFGVMGEVYAFNDAGRIAPKDAGLLLGLSYSPSAACMFDVGGDVGAFPSTRYVTLFVGVTFVPFRLWGD
jgi:hypothetical protein